MLGSKHLGTEKGAYADEATKHSSPFEFLSKLFIKLSQFSTRAKIKQGKCQAFVFFSSPSHLSGNHLETTGLN